MQRGIRRGGYVHLDDPRYEEIGLGFWVLGFAGVTLVGVLGYALILWS